MSSRFNVQGFKGRRLKYQALRYLQVISKPHFYRTVILSEAKNLVFSNTWTLRLAQGDRKKGFEMAAR
jgi:hypothetical protein